MPPKLITKPVPAAEAERRLRPAVECLFTSCDNPKQALKLATQAESKRPGWPAARAVRALALRRLGRRKEAQAVAAAVLADLESRSVPADEDAAAKLHLYYREAPRQEALSARGYEAVARACEADPYMSEVSFFWHLRARDWAGAQKIATRLQRTSIARPKEEYALWTAAAVWLGTRRGTGNPRLGALAAALIKRALAGMEVPTAEIARFATRLLCSLGEFDAAKAVIENTNIVMDASEAAHIVADVAFQGGDLALAKELLRVMLSEGDSDDWGHWVRYINLGEEKDEDGTTNIDPAVVDLVEELCALATEKDLPTRGQFIAALEVQRREKDWEPLRQGVLRYFERFGSKSVCAHDLRPYVLALCSEGCIEGSELCEGLDARVVDGKVTTHINCSWIRLWLGCLEESHGKLFNRYTTLLSTELESTERQEGDDYILLAVHRLLPGPETSERYADSAVVLQAIIVMEAALRRSPHNFHFKLLLLHLYKSVGAGELAVKLWMTLDVKHVQTATLSHLVTRTILEFGCHDLFAGVMAAVERLWVENERDVPESISRAFSGGSLNAALEFIDFRDRLERSSSMVQAVLFQTMSHINPGKKNDPLGVERAWDAVGSDDARFLPGTLALDGQPLMSNEDVQCMEFWDFALYDPAHTSADMDTPNAYDGVPMSTAKQAMLLIDFLVLRCILRLASRGQEDADDIAMLRSTLASDTLGPDVGEAGRRYICNFVLSIYGEDSSVSMEENAGFLEQIAEQLQADAIVVNMDGTDVRILSRGSIATAGHFVYETLTLTSLALASLGMVDSKIMSKGKMAALGAVYGKALSSANATLIELVRPVAAKVSDSDVESYGPYAHEEAGLRNEVAFLQETLDADGQEAFWKHVRTSLRLIHGCQLTSLHHLHEALKALTTRCKMMDVKMG